VAALLPQPFFLNQLALEYCLYINTIYCSLDLVFVVFAFSVRPKYVLVFCHIVTTCSVP